MRVLSFLVALLAAFCFIVSPAASFAAEVPAVPESGMAYVVMDADSGYVICASDNCNDRFYPASLTKVLTAMVALDHSTALSTPMTVSQTAIDGIGADGQRSGFLQNGSVIDYGSLLKMMMVWSANETAYAIAENISGSVEAFIDEMNQKAADLGLAGSHFVNPCGMHSDDHYTTPMDMAKMGRASLKYPQIKELSSLPQADVTYGDTRYSFWSTNRLVNPSHYGLTYDTTYTKGETSYRFTVDGLKTGYTNPAGCCLITTSSGTDGRSLVTVVMKASTSAIAADYSYKLLKHVYANAEFYDICTQGASCGSVSVTGSPVTQADLVYGGSLTISALPDRFDPARVSTSLLVSEPLNAPLTSGTECGLAHFVYGEACVAFAAVPVVTSSDIPVNTPEPTPEPSFTPAPEVDGSEDGGSTLVILLAAVIGLVIFAGGATLISLLRKD